MGVPIFVSEKHGGGRTNVNGIQGYRYTEIRRFVGLLGFPVLLRLFCIDSRNAEISGSAENCVHNK